MANARNGNTWYVDSTGDLSTDKNVLVSSVVVTATAASAQLVLGDTVSADYTKKIDLRVATSGDSKQFEFFIRPLLFPNGIRVITCTNAVASILIITSLGGGTG